MTRPLDNYEDALQEVTEVNGDMKSLNKKLEIRKLPQNKFQAEKVNTKKQNKVTWNSEHHIQAVKMSGQYVSWLRKKNSYDVVFWVEDA